MYRIKLVTSKDKVFLSPFVYPSFMLSGKLDSFAWMAKKKGARLEEVKVDSYPLLALFTSKDVKRNPRLLFERARLIENEQERKEQRDEQRS